MFDHGSEMADLRNPKSALDLSVLSEAENVTLQQTLRSSYDKLIRFPDDASGYMLHENQIMREEAHEHWSACNFAETQPTGTVFIMGEGEVPAFTPALSDMNSGDLQRELDRISETHYTSENAHAEAMFRYQQIENILAERDAEAEPTGDEADWELAD